MSNLYILTFLSLTALQTALGSDVAPPANVENFFETELLPDGTDTRVIFHFNESYNARNNISSYIIEADIVDQAIECRTPQCPKIESCQCTGLPSRSIRFNITPRNCDNQQPGPVATVAIWCSPEDLGEITVDSNLTNCEYNGTISIDNGYGCYRPEDGVGSTVIFSCYKGYIMTGNDERKCLYNGTWSGSMPKCIKESSSTDGTPTPVIPIVVPIVVITVIVAVVFIAVVIVIKINSARRNTTTSEPKEQEKIDPEPRSTNGKPSTTAVRYSVEAGTVDINP